MLTMRALFTLSMSLLLALPASAQSVTSAAASSSAASSSRTSTSTSSSTSSSTSGSPTIHRVNVGRGGFSYEPNVTFASEGDIVQFVFYQTNHSVIRAEYAGSDSCGGGGCNPCIPWDLLHGDGGFHSGNQLVDASSTPLSNSIRESDKVWNYTVTNMSEPIFYYCNAVGSCHPNGMVGVINPNEMVSLDKQKEAAIKAPFQLAPGEAYPAEGATGSETASASGSQPTATNGATANTAHHSSLSGGAIAGIVIGGLAVLAIAAALFYFMGRSKTYKDMFKASRGSEGGAGMSETGDRVGPWTPGPHGQATVPYQDNPSISTPSQGYQDHRISHMTYNSMAAPSEGGTFVGYNRNTGEPEFAAEAPADTSGAQYSTHSSPAQKQGGFQPSAPIPERQVYEAPGDTPRRSEKPA